MRKRVIVFIVMMLLLALVIGVRVLGALNETANEVQPTESVPGVVVADPTSVPSAVDETPMVEAPTVEAPVAESNTAAAANQGSTGYVYSDPNMSGEAAPDMEIEDEMEIALEENTAGGLL